LITEKIAEFAPIPSASVSTAMSETAGCLNSSRAAYPRSF
jgi:hypothetical protein